MDLEEQKHEKNFLENIDDLIDDDNLNINYEALY